MIELNYQVYLYKQVKSITSEIKVIDAFKTEYNTVNKCVSKKHIKQNKKLHASTFLKA